MSSKRRFLPVKRQHNLYKLSKFLAMFRYVAGFMNPDVTKETSAFVFNGERSFEKWSNKVSVWRYTCLRVGAKDVRVKRADQRCTPWNFLSPLRKRAIGTFNILNINLYVTVCVFPDSPFAYQSSDCGNIALYLPTMKHFKHWNWNFFLQLSHMWYCEHVWCCWKEWKSFRAICTDTTKMNMKFVTEYSHYYT
jgi:hypothetical protein